MKGQYLSTSVYKWVERHVRDEIVPVLALFQTAEGHFGAWNILLWVLEVFELSFQITSASADISERQKSYQGPFTPCHRLLLICVGVLEALYLSRLATEEAVQVRADLVAVGSHDAVTLCASCLSTGQVLVIVTRQNRKGGADLEKICALLRIT